MDKIEKLLSALVNIQDDVINEITLQAINFKRQDTKRAHEIIDCLAKARSCLFKASLEYEKFNKKFKG